MREPIGHRRAGTYARCRNARVAARTCVARDRARDGNRPCRHASHEVSSPSADLGIRRAVRRCHAVADDPASTIRRGLRLCARAPCLAMLHDTRCREMHRVPAGRAPDRVGARHARALGLRAASSLRFFADVSVAVVCAAAIAARSTTVVRSPNRAPGTRACVSETPAGGSCVDRVPSWRRSATRSTFRSRAARDVQAKACACDCEARGAARGVCWPFAVLILTTGGGRCRPSPPVPPAVS
jgi:hypothetical protein